MSQPGRFHLLSLPLALSSLACCLSSSPSAPGEPEGSLLFEERNDAVPEEVRDAACMDALVVDLNGDGALDVVLAIEFGANRVLLNDGTAQFRVAEALPATRRDSEDALALDTDQDGDLDLVFVSEDDQLNEHFINASSGTSGSLSFALSEQPLPATGTSNGAVAVDFNNNGRLEIFVANAGSNFLFELNPETGFREISAQVFPVNTATSQDVELGDIDGDGDLDVLWANEGQNALWLNVDGVFVDASDRLPTREDETREADFGDVDGDGDLDIVLANVQLFTEFSPDNQVLLNDGQGYFSVLEGALPADGLSSFDVDLADLNDDGALDLVLANWRGRGPGPYQILLGTGDGTFAPVEGLELVQEAGLDVEIADFNGDGKLDLYLCSRGGIGAGGSRDHVLIAQ